jgi:hypothetical protein
VVPLGRYVFERRWTINRIILVTCNALAQAHSSNITIGT